MVRLIAAMITAALLAGCASTPDPGPSEPASRPPDGPGVESTGGGELSSPEPVIPPVREAEPTPVEPAARPAPSVTMALRTESARAAASGDAGRAIELLERAIRIDPSRPELWFDLAERYLDAGDPARAAQLVEKGGSLVDGDRALERRMMSLRRRVALAEGTG
jgi:hypothetical protein